MNRTFTKLNFVHLAGSVDFQTEVRGEKDPLADATEQNLNAGPPDYFLQELLALLATGGAGRDQEPVHI